MRKILFISALLSVFCLSGCGGSVPAEETFCPEPESVAVVEMTDAFTVVTDPTEPTELTVPDIPAAAEAWYTLGRLIYHACGGVDKANYTNSREAMESTLNQGNMLVEADFLFTDDGHLICAHKWTDVFGYERSCTLEEFLAHKIRGKFSGLTAADIIQYMEDNPLLHIIVDTKEEDPTVVVAELIRLCDGRSEIADRIVIQLYEPGQKEKMLSLYPFPHENFLFTCYKYGPGRVTQILALCKEEGIRVVTVAQGSWGQETVNRFLNEGIVLFEHTVNSASTADLSLKKGFYGFYTDFLRESDLHLPEEIG